MLLGVRLWIVLEKSRLPQKSQKTTMKPYLPLYSTNNFSITSYLRSTSQKAARVEQSLGKYSICLSPHSCHPTPLTPANSLWYSAWHPHFPSPTKERGKGDRWFPQISCVAWTAILSSCKCNSWSGIWINFSKGYVCICARVRFY